MDLTEQDAIRADALESTAVDLAQRLSDAGHHERAQRELNRCNPADDPLTYALGAGLSLSMWLIALTGAAGQRFLEGRLGLEPGEFAHVEMVDVGTDRERLANADLVADQFMLMAWHAILDHRASAGPVH